MVRPNKPEHRLSIKSPDMEELLLDILAAIRRGQESEGVGGGLQAQPEAPHAEAPAQTQAPQAGPRALDDRELEAIIRRHNEGRGRDGASGPSQKPFAKKQLLPYYQRVKREEPERWRSWGIDETEEQALVQTLRMKPGRTASGVATITVLTKPWPCSGDCLYCPNDVRMPKSYLHKEPACQRAERSFFDPYLQVATRLDTLIDMGHVTDKVELIVLGGTWDDYPGDYQTWFVCGLFAALNDDAATRRRTVEERQGFYRRLGIASEPNEAEAFAAQFQQAVDAGELSYNQAVRKLYGEDEAWRAAAAAQHADDEKLARLQRKNETARHRCVGLVVETRPDAVTPATLRRLRQLGCTKVQMGIQSLDPDILALNSRTATRGDIERAFELLRLFGFKTHVHAMLNLRGSTPDQDIRDYQELVGDPAFKPDEVKLYPCVLVGGTKLERLTTKEGDARTGCGSEAGEGLQWRPYSEKELVEVLSADMAATPPYTRISRMIRDISSDDILAGNKKTNLRETVDARLDAEGVRVEEMRHREVRAQELDPESLALSVVPYQTSVSQEFFLQWTTPENKLAGFLRLSLPKPECVQERAEGLPIGPGEAMIREVHVYGRVAALREGGQNAQHLGLGRSLVRKACAIAAEHGYGAINVISAVGTREYYRRLGFADHGLYLQKTLWQKGEEGGEENSGS